MVIYNAGLGGSAVVCAIYPFYENFKEVLLLLVALLGVLNSIAFSTSYQIVTHFTTSNSVALTTGEQLSSCMQQMAPVRTLQWRSQQQQCEQYSSLMQQMIILCTRMFMKVNSDLSKT